MVTLTLLCGLSMLLLCGLAVILPYIGFAAKIILYVVLVFSILLLLVVYLARSKWKKAGRMRAEYIHAHQGLKRFGLQFVKYGSFALLIWQWICILLSIALLIAMQKNFFSAYP